MLSNVRKCFTISEKCMILFFFFSEIHAQKICIFPYSILQTSRRIDRRSKLNDLSEKMEKIYMQMNCKWLRMLYINTVEPLYPDTRFSRHSAYHVTFSKSRFSVYDFNVNKLRMSRWFCKIGHFPYLVEFQYLHEIFVIL